MEGYTNIFMRVISWTTVMQVCETFPEQNNVEQLEEFRLLEQKHHTN